MLSGHTGTTSYWGERRKVASVKATFRVITNAYTSPPKTVEATILFGYAEVGLPCPFGSRGVSH